MMSLLKFHQNGLRVRLWRNIVQHSDFHKKSSCTLDSFIKSAASHKNYSNFAHSYLTNKQFLTVNSHLVSKVINYSSISAEQSNQQQTNDEEAQKKNSRSWQLMKFGMTLMGLAMGFAGLTVLYEIGKPKVDPDGNPIEDEFSHLPYFSQMFYRLKKEFTYYKKIIQEPSREKLLPDPLTHPYIQPPYTVVLEMTDVLVHPDWTYQTGWRFKKRPGVDAFLEAIAPPQFETVVYTAEQGLTVFPILDALDPQGYIMYRLVRDATRFVDGHHVKDLDALNRDLSKVIVIDWNSESVKFHPDNTLKIPKWTGSDNDTQLYDLAAFLKTILQTNVEDVREVLRYYRQFDNPLEAFRENQRKLLAQMEQDSKMMTEEKPLTARWAPSFLKSH
ncbi:mitochondrial import inner membrane translocase subunit TIM50-C-like [Trichogramma pretiosum]|uniref:mitochondrial import inner membrane translocase subunit TIM50-C-like n=1 Tax=Trichogramma pretiosum TaxID=7493 RepID=UPI0006C95F0E|nr:mitochondrial import inner membrane translocase subunit TIM50-C-like [Trichogramma pretiosum]XP_014233008.1 mitochondrial import inner membrane translocase subunit TIM50-C-like [Trichogramma pretiosum]